MAQANGVLVTSTLQPIASSPATTASPSPRVTAANPAALNSTHLLPSAVHSGRSTVSSPLFPFAISNNTSPTTTRSILPLFTADISQSGHPDSPRESLYNYFYIFLAVFLVAFILAAWFLRRRHQKKRDDRRGLRQSALARDLVGWSAPRRWLGGGGWRLDHGASPRRDEGLDGLGNAPPAYLPPLAAAQTEEGDGSRDPVPIPLRTIPRPDTITKPPEYIQTVTEISPADADEQH